MAGLAVVFCTLFLTGCTNERVVGETTIFTFAWWVPLTILAAGMLAVAVGVLTRHTRFGWAFLIGGPIAAFFFAPSMWSDRITLDHDHFTMRTGFWMMPTTHDVRFDDLHSIDQIAESRRTRRGRSTSYYLHCHRKSGESSKVPINDLMKRGAYERILQEAIAHSVPINDHT